MKLVNKLSRIFLSWVQVLLNKGTKDEIMLYIDKSIPEPKLIAVI